MSPKLFRVHPWEAANLWHSIESGIAKALERSNSDFTAERIRQKIDAGHSQLWVIASGEKILAAGTTELVELENGRKLCMVSTLAGEDMAVWDHTWETFERFAKESGCDAIQIVGRIGWVRYLRDRGFKQPWCVLEKDL